MKTKIKFAPLPLFFLCTSILFSGYSILILSSIIKLELNNTLVYSYIFFGYTVIFICISKSFKNFSLGAIVFYYMSVLSFGFPLAFIFDYDLAFQRLMREKFFYGVYFDKYIALSVLALNSFIIGNVVRIDSLAFQGNIIKHKEKKDFYYPLGLTFISLYAFYLFINWVAGNIPTAYLEFKEWSSTQLHNYLKMLFWFGSIFVMASSTKKQIGVAIIVFIVPATILAITGNRNDLLYPLLIGIGMYVYRFKKIPKTPIIIAGLFIFIISPIIATTRSTGVNLDSTLEIANLIAMSLMELGGQIASVSSMFYWLENGENFALGGTYLFATIALLFGFINPNIRDLYFLSRFSIETRLPTLAFTMSAEVYYNFSFIGVIVIYILVGYFLRKYDKAYITSDKLVVFAFFALILLHLVRNQFYFSAVYFIVFLLIYIFEKLIRKYFLGENKASAGVL